VDLFLNIIEFWNFKALDKAKEAARQWRTADGLRKSAGNEQQQQNMDLSWIVLVCLAQQKLGGNIPSEALHIFHTIVKSVYSFSPSNFDSYNTTFFQRSILREWPST
jgi:hypothetical protein